MDSDKLDIDGLANILNSPNIEDVRLGLNIVKQYESKIILEQLSPKLNMDLLIVCRLPNGSFLLNYKGDPVII